MPELKYASPTLEYDAQFRFCPRDSNMTPKIFYYKLEALCAEGLPDCNFGPKYAIILDSMSV